MIITCGDKVLALRSRGGGIGLILFAREGSPGDCHDDDSLLVNDLLMMVMTIQWYYQESVGDFEWDWPFFCESGDPLEEDLECGWIIIYFWKFYICTTIMCLLMAVVTKTMQRNLVLGLAELGLGLESASLSSWWWSLSSIWSFIIIWWCFYDQSSCDHTILSNLLDGEILGLVLHRA